MSDLALARNSIASVSTGKAVNEDAWMAQWCMTNWGDLLQPAPLSIALIGSILITASSIDDFSLVSDTPPGCPPFKWEFAKRPNSFKTCLQQMVGDGYTAYETTHRNMETINNTAGQIPGIIRDLVDLILKGTPRDIANLLQNGIDDLVGLSNKCGDAAKETEQGFKNLAGLAQEMVLACTYKSGSAEEALSQNEITLAVLKVQKEQQEAMVRESKESNDAMKKSYIEAEASFHEAVKEVPQGWDLVGMQVVESLTNLVISAGNAAISRATMSEQTAYAGVGAYSDLTGGGKEGKQHAEAAAAATPAVPATSPSKVSTQPNQAALSDPGTMVVQRVLDQANNIKALLVGKDGKPDWDKISSKKADVPTEASYVLSSLQSLQSKLEAGKPISTQLGPMANSALNIIGTVIKAGKDITGLKDDALLKEVPPTDDLIGGLNGLVASVNLILQQPASVATGPATPPTPAVEGDSSAVKLIMDTIKFKVDQTRSQLDASRQSYELASDRLCQQQKAITNTIQEMLQLNLGDTNLRQLLPVLKKAVGAFTTMRAQVLQLVEFFGSITSLFIDVMKPSIERWAATITANEKQIKEGGESASVGGVTISAFTRDVMFRQLMVPLKVATLAVQISGEYVEISNMYILPAQRSLGQLLQFNDDDENRESFVAHLGKSQELLSKQATKASEEISAKVKKDQEIFANKIKTRLSTIVETTQKAIPAVAKPLPAAIKEVAESHAADFDKMKANQAALNPMFNPDDAM